MLKMIYAAASVVMIIIGLIVLPLPIPLGAIMIVCGIIMLISASATVTFCVKSYRRHHPRANKIIHAIESKLPASLKKILKRTDP